MSITADLGRGHLSRHIPAKPFASSPGLDWIDITLIVVFFIGIYTNYSLFLSKTVPFPSAPAGIAGAFMLWRRRGDTTTAGLAAGLVVLATYATSVLLAPDLSFLPRRVNGLVQLSYSLAIGYALFATVTRGTREQIAALFLSCALVLLIGCLLETYGGLRPLSDAVRQVLYSRGLYEADLRDLQYYDQIRPKFFASEPSSVTFCYTLFSFLWLVVSSFRWKLAGYALLTGCGLFAMPGPTLLLMVVLLVPWMLFLASRRDGRIRFGRLLPVGLACLLCGAMFVVLALTVFSQRHRDAAGGDDASAFYRVRGPAIAALDVLRTMPIAGAGLTGEPYVKDRVLNLYVRSPGYSSRWPLVHPSSELLINYFWLHWIYLGVLMGTLALAVVTIWLMVLGVPSPAFAWTVWAILGQAAGAYVGPACWAVLFLAGAAALINQRRDDPDARRSAGLIGMSRSPAGRSLLPGTNGAGIP
jgi:hypothetical protein